MVDSVLPCGMPCVMVCVSDCACCVCVLTAAGFGSTKRRNLLCLV